MYVYLYIFSYCQTHCLREEKEKSSLENLNKRLEVWISYQIFVRTNTSHSTLSIICPAAREESQDGSHMKSRFWTRGSSWLMSGCNTMKWMGWDLSCPGTAGRKKSEAAVPTSFRDTFPCYWRVSSIMASQKRKAEL